jgi:hypothetical protein
MKPKNDNACFKIGFLERSRLLRQPKRLPLVSNFSNMFANSQREIVIIAGIRAQETGRGGRDGLLLPSENPML